MTGRSGHKQVALMPVERRKLPFTDPGQLYWAAYIDRNIRALMTFHKHERKTIIIRTPEGKKYLVRIRLQDLKGENNQIEVDSE